MSNQYLNPDSLFDARPFGFSQAVVSRVNGAAYLSGQTAWDRSAKLSGGTDFAGQDCSVQRGRKCGTRLPGVDDEGATRSHVLDEPPCQGVVHAPVADQDGH